MRKYILVILAAFELLKGSVPKLIKVVEMVEKENVVKNIYDSTRKKKVWLSETKSSAEIFY